jgi:hypothetical protein
MALSFQSIASMREDGNSLLILQALSAAWPDAATALPRTTRIVRNERFGRFTGASFASDAGPQRDFCDKGFCKEFTLDRPQSGMKRKRKGRPIPRKAQLREERRCPEADDVAVGNGEE